MNQLQVELTEDRVFDRYAHQIKNMLGTSMSTISLIEGDVEFLPGASGIPDELEPVRQVPTSVSLCRFVVAGSRPLIFSDAREVPLVKDSPAVTQYGVIAYAGMPLRDSSGQTIGAVCAIHQEPHEWTDAELADLADIAEACSAELVERETAAE